MPSGLSSPRHRPERLADVGERSTFIARQRIDRARRRRRVVERALRAVEVTLLVALVPLLLGLGVHWVLTTPRFAIGDVDVRGASRVPAERVLEAAAIEPGTSIFRLDTSAAASRILAIPEVRRADIVRALPNRVVITVEERRPFTLVHAGRLHWLDEDGRLLGASPEAVEPPAPVISGLSEEELSSMRTVPGPKARVAIGLIRALLRSGSALTTEISEIDMSRGEGPVLYTVDGLEIRLGNQDWEERLARLEGVLAQVATEDVRAVDLRFRDQVVFQRGGTR